MKRIISLLLVCLFAAMPLAGCHKDEKKKSSVVVAKHQTSDDCEEAFREFFSATYSENAGEICLAYMYPAKVMNAYRNNGQYEDYVVMYNNHQQKFVSNLASIPEITEITGRTELNDEQLQCALKYFIAKSAELVTGMTEDDIKVTKGTEISLRFKDQEQKEQDDKETMVYIEDDGWKCIPYSLERLTEIYSGEASEPTT